MTTTTPVLTTATNRVYDVLAEWFSLGMQVQAAELVQVQAAGGEYGTVCGMVAEAADVVCRQLGYSFGSLTTTDCGSFNS